MNNLQIDKKTTKQVRIDAGLHQLLKVYAAESKLTIKELLEDCLSDLLAIDKPKIYKTRAKTVVSLEKRNENGTQTDQNRPSVNSKAFEPKNPIENIAQPDQKTYNLIKQ